MQIKVTIELSNDDGKRFFRSTSQAHESISEAFSEVAPLSETMIRQENKDTTEVVLVGFL